MGEAQDKTLLEVLEKAKENEWKIDILFQKRKLNQTKTPMKLQIDYFYACLFLLNSIMVDGSNAYTRREHLSKLQTAPKAVEERMTFIEEKPGHYYSHKQLKQLFKELEQFIEQKQPDGEA